jgi:SAM-dependent methyltransferase
LQGDPAAAAAARSIPARGVSIRPGINADFLGKEVDMTRWVNTFEGETREIATRSRPSSRRCTCARRGRGRRRRGHGLFLDSLAEAVGVGGKVYALDISPEFVQHLADARGGRGPRAGRRAALEERSVDLPPMSLDAAFVCDTYHHFEFPQSMLFSMYKALRPSGKLYSWTSRRSPASRAQWVLDHVRADKRAVTKEIERAASSSRRRSDRRPRGDVRAALPAAVSWPLTRAREGGLLSCRRRILDAALDAPRVPRQLRDTRDRERLPHHPEVVARLSTRVAGAQTELDVDGSSRRRSAPTRRAVSARLHELLERTVADPRSVVLGLGEPREAGIHPVYRPPSSRSSTWSGRR